MRNALIFVYKWVKNVARLLRSDHLVLSVLAAIIGLAAGYGTILLRITIEFLQSIFFGASVDGLVISLATLSWWQILIVPTIGGLLVGLLVFYLMPSKKPEGIAQVIEASALREGKMSLRNGVVALLASATSIGAGASVGREGPAVHIGATIGSWLAEKLHLTKSMSRTLLGCGAAAAVAASFNAPIAGALFAHEVIVGHFALSAFAPIVISSVVGTIVSRAYFGDYPAFTVSEYAIESIEQFPAVIGLGVCCGILAIIFMKSIAVSQDKFSKLMGPEWIRPAVAGFLVGLIALGFPQVMGVGYDATDLALKGEFTLAILVALVIFKTLATAISLGGGFGGGVFTPSIMIGAMLGGAYGLIITGIFPNLNIDPGAFTVIGMGGLAAAVLGAPVSTTLIIFELTDDYPLTIAVMVSVVISSLIAKQFVGGSFFKWQLERSGYDLEGGFEAALLRGIPVSQITLSSDDTVEIGAGIQHVRNKLQTSKTGELFVLRDDTQLYGTITLSDLSEIAFDHDVDNLINAGDIARINPPVLSSNQNLYEAIKVIKDSGEHYIAIVDGDDSMKFVGVLSETDLMSAYNKALVDLRKEEHEGGV